jgi:hypothetical protein
MGGDLAPSGIHPNSNWVVRRDGTNKVRVLQRRGTDNHSGYSTIEQSLGCIFGSYAATDLNRNTNRGTNGPNGVTVCRLAGEGSIKVNHVDPLNTSLNKLHCLLDWIIGVDGFLVIVAPEKPDTIATSEIDSWVKDHA